MMRATILALAGLSFIVALAACGKQGDLDRPGPMWGPKERAEASAQQRARADAASNAAASNEVIEPQNPAVEPFTTTAPIHDQPIPGEQTLPSGTPPGGGQTPQ